MAALSVPARQLPGIRYNRRFFAAMEGEPCSTTLS
jgi:hypothetical protein